MAARIQEMQQNSITDAMYRMFEHIDADNSGHITQEEFEGFIKHLGLEGERGDMFVSILGINDQSHIDFGHFCRGFTQVMDNASSASIQPDVFLGGTCGQTTWRAEMAIPMLEAEGVGYYNPQVKDWNPHLTVLENVMKASCRTLLFFVDSSTRSIMSMIEAAQYICCGRDVVLVINPIIPGTSIDGVKMSEREVKDLNRAREYLAHIAELHKTPVYKSVLDACVAIIAKKKQREAEEKNEED